MTSAPVAPRRVVVTGLGVACALGLDPETLWRRLLAGECGISRLARSPEEAALPVTIAGAIPDDALAAAMRSHHPRESDRNSQLALYVAERALADAGHPTDGAQPIDMDVIVGSGHGNIAFTNESSVAFEREGYRKLRPTTVVRAMFNRPAHLVSIRYRLTGASHVVSCACASGSIAVGEAFHRIRFGIADQVLAACCDTGLDPATFAAWNRLGVLSRIADPEGASRPFDEGRDGLVIGEGGAALVLESLDAARPGARAYARWWATAPRRMPRTSCSQRRRGRRGPSPRPSPWRSYPPSTSTTSMPTGRPPSSRIPWRRPRCAWCSAPTPTGYRSPPPRPSSVI
jgi:3-oxoacyl-[acyl-carrier-protein] synthase II